MTIEAPLRVLVRMGGGRAIELDSSKLDEFIVKTFGNTAVVWFTQILVGPVNGKPTEVRYRYVDVWVNRGGRWLAVASQSTRLNAKE